MQLDAFKALVFDLAQQAGFTQSEIYYAASDGFSVNISQGEIEDYTVENIAGLSFRGLYQGRMGYAATEVFSEQAARQLVDAALGNAQVIEDDDVQEIFAGSETYAQVDAFSPALEQVSAADKIARAQQLEQAMLTADERVLRSESAVISTSKSSVSIQNTKGLNLNHTSNMALSYAIPIVRDGEGMNNGMAFKIARDFDQLDPTALAQQSVQEALGYVGASSIPSGSYKAALRYDVMYTLLEVFSGIFVAEQAQKGLSLLKGKVGQTIAAPCVTLIDDPLLPGGFASTPFDAEGVATRTKAVIENGVLTTLLYNLKTAAKDGVATTGNAVKGGYAAPVKTAPFNFYLQPGELSPEALYAKMGRGVLICDLAGTHAGANAATGEFSLSAKGFWIEDGKIVKPVEQITVAGNFYELLKGITDVGSDLEFSMSCCGSPTVLLDSLAVAGL